MRFRSIAVATHDVGWPFQVAIYLHVITPIETQLAKSRRREIRKTVSRSGRDHEVVSFRMLQDAPHRFDIFWRPSPIALNCEIAELNSVLATRADAARGAHDLFGDEA